MIDGTTFRRREDGSLDIDFYRRQGLAERGAIMSRAIRRAGKRGMSFAALSIISAGFGAMFAATGTAGPAPM